MPDHVKREAYETKTGEVRERWRVRIQRKDLKLDRCFRTRKEAEDAAKAASTPQGAAFLKQEQEKLSLAQLAAKEAKRLLLERMREKTVSEILALYLRKRFGFDPLKDEKPLAEMTDDERRKRNARISDQARIAAFTETHLPIERDEAGRIVRVGEAEGLAAFLPDRAKRERIGSLRVSDLDGPQGEALVLAYIRSRKETVGERSKKPISLGSIRREINVFRSIWNNLPLWVSGASNPKINPFAGRTIGKSLEGANAERERRLSSAESSKIREGLAAYSNPQVRAFVLLLLMTGMRRGEIETTTWGQIEILEEDGEKKGQILLTKQQTKKKKGRAVWLSPEAIAVLEEMGRGEASEKIFSIRGNGVLQAFRKICRKAGIPDLRLHDLRAEFVSSVEERFPLISSASVAQQLGVGASYLEKWKKAKMNDAKDGPTSPEALRRIVGHASQASASPYQRGINVEAFRNALEAEKKTPLAIPVVVEEDEGGGVLVECPDLGLTLAAGSEEEAMALMRKAISKRIRKGGFSVSSVQDLSKQNPGKLVETIQFEAAA